jgi:hypothetical protein
VVGPRTLFAAAALLILQSALSGCAARGTGTPAKRDIVSVAYAEPRALTGDTGEEVAVRSVVGSVEEVYPGSFLLRVDDATAVNGATATLLAGRAITVSGHGNARVTVVRADTSTRDRAFVFGLPALAFLAGFVGTLLHYH